MEGINQTLSAALGLADKDGNPCEAKVVSSALVWAFVHYPDTWTEYYPLVSKEGHLPLRNSHLSTEEEFAAAWAATLDQPEAEAEEDSLLGVPLVLLRE